MKQFRYKKPRKKRPPVEDIRPAQEGAPAENPLTGYIDGIPADSMAEERFANSMKKSLAIMGFKYKFIIGTEGMPGWKQLDFLVEKVDGQILAVSVKDTEFIHHGEAATAQDAANEMYIIEKLRQQQIYIDSVKTIDAKDLDTQALSDKTLQRLI
jgi:hypothetical protein